MNKFVKFIHARRGQLLDVDGVRVRQRLIDAGGESDAHVAKQEYGRIVAQSSRNGRRPRPVIKVLSLYP